MKHRINPFVISGYVSAEYFCDRKAETAQLIREVSNGNNVALISTRRMGKTGLIQHCFRNPELKDGFYNFFIDIYATKSLREFVFSLSRTILETLKPRGRKAMGQSLFPPLIRESVPHWVRSFRGSWAY